MMNYFIKTLISPADISPLNEANRAFTSSALEIDTVLRNSSFSCNRLYNSSPLAPTLINAMVDAGKYLRKVLFSLIVAFSCFFNMALGSLSFEKGKIALLFEYYTENEEAKAILKKQEKATIKLNSTFLSQS